MTKRILVLGFFSLLSILAFVACASKTTESMITSTSSTVKTTENTTVQQITANTANTAGTAEAGGFTFEKLDVLDSYNIVMIGEAMAGPAKGMPNKFDADHAPPEQAYHYTHYIARNGKDYDFMQETIVIGDNEWVKSKGKEWTTGSGLSAIYIFELKLLYMSLAKGEVKRINDESIAGILTIHYSYMFETGSTRMSGEVWIANQNDMPKIIVKSFGEQGFLDKDGNLKDDPSHIKNDFEITRINAAVQIKPPM